MDMIRDGSERTRYIAPIHHARWLLALALLFVAASAIAELLTQPVPKAGACPSGWHASGNYCVPNSKDTLPIVPKVGVCPSGWHAAGNYCVANSESSKPIVPKQGACPHGWHASGAWCQKG